MQSSPRPPPLCPPPAVWLDRGCQSPWEVLEEKGASAYACLNATITNMPRPPSAEISCSARLLKKLFFALRCSLS